MTNDASMTVRTPVDLVPYEPAMPIDELDRALRPLRRVLAWISSDVDVRATEIRYLGANGGHWFNPALKLDLPAPVREAVVEIGNSLSGFDEAEDRPARARAMWQTIGRLDAWLGLPLEGKLSPPQGELPAFEALERDVLVEETIVAGVLDDDVLEIVEEDEEKGFRLGDPAHTGLGLGEPALPGGIVVDPELALALAEEGIETIADLLLLPPVDEIVVRPIHGAGRTLPEGRAAVGGRVRRRVTRLVPGAPASTSFELFGAGALEVRFSRPVAMWFVEAMAPESRVVLVGDVRTVDDRSVLYDAEPVHSDGNVVRLNRYGVEGIDDAVIRVLLWRFLPMAEQVRDTLDVAARARLVLPKLSDAILNVHRLGTARPDARRRLAFDEALLLQLALETPRFQASRERGIAHVLTHLASARLSQQSEDPLDDTRASALEDIKRDLRRTIPMQRVLTGPGGTGKFQVALHAAALVAETKAQVVITAPDAMSAELRYAFAEPLLREIGIVAKFVDGEPTKAQREALRRGDIHVLFGTADMLDHDVEYRRLGLVIAEEREPWGRAPAKLQQMRAPRPDLLVVGTTPIPAAVMLSAYGDCDLSVLQSVRPAPVVSVFGEDHREEAYKVAVAAVASGRQAYVLFPMAASDEGRQVDVLDLREAKQVVDVLASKMFPGLRVSLFHGQQPREDRQRVYEEFRHRRADVLVATAPVEDGPPVAAATVLVVEQADRMPLHRLLRLQGHVSDGIGGEARLVLITGREPDHAGLERIKRITEPGDAWAVAEWDAKTRGLAPLIARDVHGGSRLRWLDPAADRELLVLAREEAHELLTDDPSLRRGLHNDLGKTLRDRWDELLPTPCPLPDAGGPGGASGKRRRRRRKRK